MGTTGRRRPNQQQQQQQQQHEGGEGKREGLREAEESSNRATNSAASAVGRVGRVERARVCDGGAFTWRRSFVPFVVQVPRPPCTCPPRCQVCQGQAVALS